MNTEIIKCLDTHLEFFSKAKSLFTKGQSNKSILNLFKKCWVIDKELSMKLLFWFRDCHNNGVGNRNGSKECYRWIAENDPKWLECNIEMIPEVGRWDDLRSLFGTKLEEKATELWSNAILIDKNVLAAKWADRNDKPLFYNMRSKLPRLNIGDFRRMLSKIRKNHIVEHKMCENRWDEIEYSEVPSIAMSRYNKAFTRHDENRFIRFKERNRCDDVKVNDYDEENLTPVDKMLKALEKYSINIPE